MKIAEKKLKKEAERIHNEILQRNEPKLKEFLAEKYGDIGVIETTEPKRNTNRKLFFGAVAALLVIIVSFSLWAIFAPNDDGGNNPINHYLKDNEIYATADLAQIKQDMHYVSLELNPQIITGISLIRDSVSNDDLYYLIGISIEEEVYVADARVFIVTNKKFTLPFYLPEGNTTMQINGLEVKYHEYTVEENDLYVTASKAVITTAHEIIYVDYSGYSLDEQSIFLDWLEGIVKTK